MSLRLRIARVVLVVCAAASCCAVTRAADEGPHWPGLQPGGQTLLHDQWSIQPAGKQVELGSFPVNLALHPKLPFAAVLNAGFGKHEVMVVDLKRGEVIARVTVPQAFYGVTFDPSGTRLFVSGGEYEVVHQWKFADGKLTEPHDIRIVEEKTRWIPAGLACSPDGRTLYIAGAWGGEIAAAPLEIPTQLKRLAMDKGSFPYAVLPTRDGSRLYVSLWGQSAIAVVDPSAWKVTATWPAGLPVVGSASSHPTEMVLSPDEKLLYVACANSNSVVVFDTENGRAVEQISSAMEPQSLPGSTPNSVASSLDGKVLAVANADNNDVALIDVRQRGQSHSLGFIPAGWYPTSVRFDRTSGEIYVLNGKGIEARANPHGPTSPVKSPDKKDEYVGGLYRGTLAIVEPPAPAEMARYSQQALAGNPLRNLTAAAAARRSPDNPIPLRSGEPSPIKHCIYIIKENRTYDQVFGDMQQGNGDPRLCIFDRRVTPNEHALAEEFVLLDNTYTNAEVSAQGHEWSTAAYCTDFVEKAWPLSYRGDVHGKIGYPSEGDTPQSSPAAGYIWDRCQQAGVSFYDYGEFVDNGPAGKPSHTNVKALQGHFDPQYHGWDLDYPDAKRADHFIDELHRFEQTGMLPQLTMIRLPNDHTRGTARGKPTPAAMVADNDLALGRVIEAISHSRFWPETAVFVIEDDSQNGSDHVDAHRTVSLVVSPYVRRHAVDSTAYCTPSLLRTMELILGLKPLCQFDEAAVPMFASFQAKPDLTPFTHRAAEVNLAAVNGTEAWGADVSAKLDFSREDAADDLVLGEIVWRSVRGASSPMPPPVHAAFVRTRPPRADGKDDDD